MGCFVLQDYGKESQAKDVIEEYFKCKKWMANKFWTSLVYVWLMIWCLWNISFELQRVASEDAKNFAFVGVVC